MLMLDDHVQVHAHVVHMIDVHLFQGVHQTRLVHMLLQRVQVKVEGLVLMDDGRPQVENLVHGILFESGETYCLLEGERNRLEQLLTVVATGKELRDLRSAPDDLNLFGALLSLDVVEVTLILVVVLLSQLAEYVLESLGFQTISGNHNEINLMLSHHVSDLSAALLVDLFLLSLLDLQFWSAILHLLRSLRDSRRQEMVQILLVGQLTILVNNG